MNIKHNIPGIKTLNRLQNNENNTAKSLEKLSSGLRINRAADDSAGLAISEKMKAQIRGLEQANRNIRDGISLIQTAEAGLAAIENPNLQRMRELAVQAANDTLTKSDRQVIQKEIEQIKKGINEIANNTHFNGIRLLNVPDSGSVTKTELIGSTEKVVTVNPGEHVLAGYIDVPQPADPSTLKVKAYLGTLSGAIWPDMNIKSPTGEWFGYSEAKLSGSSYQEDVANLSSSKATYTGWGSSDEEMTFENPVAGKWYIEIRHDGGTESSTFSLESNYLIYGGETSTETIWTENPPGLKLQVGANSEQNYLVDLSDVRTNALELDAVIVDPREKADEAITIVDQAIEKVSAERTKFGAYQNTLEHIQNNLNNYTINLTASESRIRDANMAKEMMTFTKHNILTQASQAMLSQANQSTESVLQLLGD